jgi:signal transduction histidine kinase/DNA-binding LacI/PurR family transcriptional regulator
VVTPFPNEGRHSTSTRRIAVLTATLSEAYQQALWKGLSREVRHHADRVVCFPGSRINSPIIHEAAATSIFDLVNDTNFDGGIVVSSTIFTYLEGVQIQEFFDRRASIPLVSVGVPVAGVGTVAVHTDSAVVEITRHVVEDHHRRNVAIIAGPRWHVESESRREAVVGTLESLGVGWRHDRLVHGNFDEQSGRASAATLIDRDATIDAIVCLNDRMALGALGELSRRGIRVPADVALVGFDGIEEGQYCTPPLTTVRQPLEELGATAYRELVRLMDGGSPREVALESRPVLRESCGCPVAPQLLRERERPTVDSWPDDARDEARRLIALAHEPYPEQFLEELNRHLTDLVRRGEPLDPWERLLSSLRTEIVENADDVSPATLVHEFQMLEAATEIVGSMRARIQAARRLDDARRSESIRTVGRTLMEAFETPVLLARLREGLRELGFSQGYLVLKEESEARLLLAVEDSSPSPDTRGAPVFTAATILPAGHPAASAPGLWVVVPLVFQSQSLGHLLLPGDAADPALYETIGKLLSAALQGALLVDRVRNHEASLEREVERRTRELRRTNRSLQREIETRARLENEVAEISRHTMERIGQDLHDDLCQHLAGVSMHVGVLEAALAAEDSAHVQAAEMVHELIKGSVERARGIVRGLFPVGLAEDGLIGAFRALVDDTRRTWPGTVVVEFGDECVDLDGDGAVELYRIVQEALNNAVKHSGASSITLRTRRNEGSLVVEVIDDGGGYEPGDEDSGGMGLKIMRYRAEKLGARLSVAPTPSGTRVRCELLSPRRGEDADEETVSRRR